MQSLPAWLIPLLDAPTMRAIDRWAIEEQGVAGLELMERAGTGVARAVERLAADGPVAVVCGKGNNGGDGFVVARLLREAGREVAVALTAEAEEIGGDARANLERLPGPEPLPPSGVREALAGASVAVDALLGTGFQGEARGAARGTGIGLSLVARFAELHRGRAWVEARDGGGASFRVLLPDA